MPGTLCSGRVEPVGSRLVDPPDPGPGDGALSPIKEIVGQDGGDRVCPPSRGLRAQSLPVRRLRRRRCGDPARRMRHIRPRTGRVRRCALRRRRPLGVGLRSRDRRGRDGRGVHRDVRVPARGRRASELRGDRGRGRPRGIRRPRVLCAHRLQRRDRRGAGNARVRGRGDPSRTDLRRQPDRSDRRVRDPRHARGRGLPRERHQRCGGLRLRSAERRSRRRVGRGAGARRRHAGRDPRRRR